MSTPGAAGAYLVPVDLFEQVAGIVTDAVEAEVAGPKLAERMAAIREDGPTAAPPRFMVLNDDRDRDRRRYIVADLHGLGGTAPTGDVLCDVPERETARAVARTLDKHPEVYDNAPAVPFDESEEPF
jgi:hypothetical protein